MKKKVLLLSLGLSCLLTACGVTQPVIQDQVTYLDCTVQNMDVKKKKKKKDYQVTFQYKGGTVYTEVDSSQYNELEDLIEKNKFERFDVVVMPEPGDDDDEVVAISLSKNRK